MSKGFVVATDLVGIIRNMDGTTTLEWANGEVREDAEERELPFRFTGLRERLYWIEELKTMTGVVEKATVYENEEGAENAAFFAASLDPNLAGHLHVTPISEALHDERVKIKARQAEKRMRDTHESKRFKLTSGEGGGI